MKTAITTMLLSIAVMLSISQSVAIETYDLVILNGQVMDPETKLDAVRNVGVKDGKLVIYTSIKSLAVKIS